MKSLLSELTNGKVTFETIEFQRRTVLINLLTIVALLALLFFAVYLVYHKMFLLGIVDFSVFATILFLHVHARKKQDYRVSIRLELFVIALLFLYVLLLSPVNVGAWGWSTIYPLVVMFTLGKKGIKYGVIFFIASMGILVLRSTPHIQMEPYQPPLISRYIFMYGINFSLAIVIEKVWHESLYLLNGVHIKLKEANVKIANQKREVEELSLHDPLTGLYNRRYFDAILHDISRISTRELSSLGIIMIDIDHFKKVNDTYGHQVGDKALVAISSAVSRVVRRQADMLFRYGGEEFILILYGPSVEQMNILANDIRVEVTQPYLISEIKTLTVSMGGILWTSQMNFKIEDAVDMADKAMYESKNRGRDRYTFFRPKRPAPDTIKG